MSNEKQNNATHFLGIPIPYTLLRPTLKKIESDEYLVF